MSQYRLNYKTQVLKILLFFSLFGLQPAYSVEEEDINPYATPKSSVQCESELIDFSKFTQVFFSHKYMRAVKIAEIDIEELITIQPDLLTLELKEFLTYYLQESKYIKYSQKANWTGRKIIAIFSLAGVVILTYLDPAFDKPFFPLFAINIGIVVDILRLLFMFKPANPNSLFFDVFTQLKEKGYAVDHWLAELE